MAETRASKKDKNQHIQVFVRVRPANDAEKLGKSSTVIEVSSSKDIIVYEKPPDKLSKKFTFDKVFGPFSKQVSIYQAVVSPLVEEVLAGYNCTVFAYGQTGTGKTFTMEGVSNDPSLYWNSDTNAGIIPRSLSHLFDELHTLDVQEYSVRVSFLELYNEELFDLLASNDDISKIRLYEDACKKGAVIIHGLEEVTVYNKCEVYKILEKGSEKRQKAATLMNAQSSRSHTVFSITIHIKENTVDGEELLKTGKLNLVDLAGSENVGRSGAVDRRAREAGNINQSLLTLGRVITSLVERAPHIPYRESKLTRLLQESLGGRTKTSIIATVSPASINLEETLSTLDYAHRARNITNRPELNQKLSKKAFLKEYTEEIERLRRDLLATRNRNGVYLAYENFNNMRVKIDYMEKDITDKINHIKALEEQKNKKDEIFNNLQTAYQVSTNDLYRTQTELTNIEGILKVTESELTKTKQKRDETAYLVEKHAATEKLLSSQAHQLLEVADIAINDTHKLCDVISRKTQVEQENEKLKQQFQQDITKGVEEIEKDCIEYLHNLLQVCINTKNDIGLQLRVQNTGIDTTIQHICKDLVNRQSMAQLSLIEHTDCSFNTYQAWINEHLQNITTVSDHEIQLLNEISLMLASKLENLIEATMQKKLQTLSACVTEKLEEMSIYIEIAKKDICHNLTMSRQRLSQNITNVKAHILAVQTKESEILQNSKSFKGEFENLCNQFTAMCKSNEANYTEVTNILMNIGKINDNINTDAIESCQNIVQSEQCYEDRVKEEIHVVKNEVQFGVNEVVSIVDTHRYKLVDELQTQLQDSSTVWIKHCEVAKQRTAKLQEVIQQERQKILSSAQVLEQLVANASVNHDEFLESQRSKSRQFNHELQHKLEEQSLRATRWATDVAAKLRITLHQVDKFITEDVQRDIPTGSTPVKTEYRYPKELAETSPHQRIIQHFRASINDTVISNETCHNENNREEHVKSRIVQPKRIILTFKSSDLLDRSVFGMHN
ncbi:kinesin-like protein Klp61F [Neodiprion fabricii]|uniref:kinesin-like protein Klp61F n=1 Tax=Neodiprion fabricii TaxID=2872261 RepID=UPI001ED8D85A|nr:kinesin-like protein Klp61F [Neodiprion fabricii]